MPVRRVFEICIVRKLTFFLFETVCLAIDLETALCDNARRSNNSTERERYEILVSVSVLSEAIGACRQRDEGFGRRRDDDCHGGS